MSTAPKRAIARQLFGHVPDSQWITGWLDHLDAQVCCCYSAGFEGCRYSSHLSPIGPCLKSANAASRVR